MTDTPEPRDPAIDALYADAKGGCTIDFTAVIRSYGDQRDAEGYAQAVADVVAWLLSGERYRPIASEITRRFGKGQDHG